MDYREGRVSIMPQACDICRETLLSFFETFFISKNLKDRKRQIEDLLQSPLSCGCREKAFQKISMPPRFLESEYQAARCEIEGLIKEYECV